MPSYLISIVRHPRPVATTAAVLLLMVSMLPSCSQEETVAPEPDSVMLEGHVDFPADGLVDVETIQVGFGANETNLSDSGGFALNGNGGIPGLAMAYGEDEIALLMAVVPDPENAGSVVLDAHSTALALVFLNPFVCTSDAEETEDVLARLETLPELYVLEQVLTSRLIVSPEALLTEDDGIDAALTDVLATYLNSYASAALAPGGMESGAPEDAPASESGISIVPDWQESGHRLTHTGGSQFKITNSIGRWAYCLTPEEDFYLFPNGTLMDILKGNPWAPSERAFSMDVAFGEEATEVNVYGLGWSPGDDNSWDDLSNLEQEYALNAGMATVLLEFVPQLVSVVTNTSTTLGRGQMGKAQIIQMLGYLKRADIIAKCEQYIQADDPMGMVKFLSETVVKEFIGNEQFRATFLQALGMTLSDGALKRVAGWILVPVRAFLTVDAITNSVKTALGFYNAQFRTTFEVWNETIEIGNVSGGVYDRDSGMGIGGAAVVLEGDDGNPMSPSHDYETGSAGSYYFHNIGAGTKTIRASKQGYQPGSVSVYIVKDSTVVAPQLILTPVSGTATGRVLDGIRQAAGLADPTFKKDLMLRVTQQDGDFDQTYTIHDGTYTLDLSPGVYLVQASHEDYTMDYVTVTVTESGATAPRDLVMHPVGSLEGTVSLDMNGDGTYESSFYISSEEVGASISDGGVFIELAALVGTPRTDVVQLVIALDQVQRPDVYELGDANEAGMGTGAAAGALYATVRETCFDPNDQIQGALVFSVYGDPDDQECNCGITDYGDLFIDDPYGTELTDVISGGFDPELSGSNTCRCYCCEDMDGDGQEDDWFVDCARAKLNVNFKVLVGSMYLIPTE